MNTGYRRRKKKEFIGFDLDMLITIILIIVLLIGSWFYMIRMPNVSFQKQAEPLTTTEKELFNNLKSHIAILSKELIGRNDYATDGLTTSKNYLIGKFQEYGYKVSLQEYKAKNRVYDNIEVYVNVEVEILGKDKPEEIIIIGAHYDSIPGSPGANDNASGVAGILELARLFHGQSLARTIRLVAFVNEEPPFFQTDTMGSLVYAKKVALKKEKIIGMIALETIGYFRDDPNSQQYPPPFSFFYPSTGNFIGFVSNLSSRQLLRDTINIFRTHATIPSEGASIPTLIPGVGWSDHWSFWQYDYPAIMITDTAPFRYPYYHTAEDTPDKIDFEKMTRVVGGVQKIVEVLANR